MTDFAALAAPFPPDRVSWRVGSSNKKRRQKETGDDYAKATKGMALAFINSRDVQERLDDVCGPGNWQDRYEFHGPRTICYLSIRVDGEWVTKADGAGDSDVEAAKGSISDALKRAAVKWGVGRYLYALPSPWVDLDEWEQIPDASMRKLEGLLRTNAAAAPQKAAEVQDTTEAADLAIRVMRTSKTLDELVDYWTKNYRAHKADFTAADFARVEQAKDAEKARLTPPPMPVEPQKAAA